LEELQGKVAAADRALKILKWIVPEEERKGTLPGLAGGPPLKR